MRDKSLDSFWGLMLGLVGIGILEYWFDKRRKDAGLPSEW
jgi:hypothetical protein